MNGNVIASAMALPVSISVHAENILKNKLVIVFTNLFFYPSLFFRICFEMALFRKRHTDAFILTNLFARLHLVHRDRS